MKTRNGPHPPPSCSLEVTLSTLMLAFAFLQSMIMPLLFK